MLPLLDKLLTLSALAILVGILISLHRQPINAGIVVIGNTRLYQQLVRAEKLAALGQLVAGVAHELNNPLTGILGYTELLKEEVQNESARRRVAKLGSEVRRLQRIVDGLLRFARHNDSPLRAADLETTLRDVIQLREHELPLHNIEIETEIEPGLPQAAIGEDELKQVLLNLLNNAVDAVEDSLRKSIRIQARRQGSRVAIRLEDSGPGFADLNRAFDPFYTTKPAGKGTGLGLSVSSALVREFGGEIRLANKTPSGASVTVELPVAQLPGVDYQLDRNRTENVGLTLGRNSQQTSPETRERQLEINPIHGEAGIASGLRGRQQYRH